LPSEEKKEEKGLSREKKRGVPTRRARESLGERGKVIFPKVEEKDNEILCGPKWGNEGTTKKEKKPFLFLLGGLQEGRKKKPLRSGPAN